MSIRVALVTFYVLFFSVYAWRKSNFISLCSLIVLMAFVQHPDMPNSIAGIPGFNHWNILFVNVFFKWRKERRIQGRVWDMPKTVSFFFKIYALFMLIATTRLLIFRGQAFYTTVDVLSEFYINTFKWLIPAIILFDECRDQKKMIIALVSVFLLYFLIALQVIKCMPLSNAVASGDALQRRAVRVLSREVGYHRVNLSMMLAGASWFAMMFIVSIKKFHIRLLTIASAAIMSLGQALTGGRTGYVTWILVGFTIGVVKWKKILFVIPVAIYAIITFVPGVKERMFTGVEGEQQVDTYEMTSGRVIIWPYVIDKIKKHPVIGYGRQAMKSTGLANYLMFYLNESFPHPHNAYLEFTLDNGVPATFSVIILFTVIFFNAYLLLKNRNDPFGSMVGGMCFSLVFALLIAGMGSQTFYPREGAFGMWAVIGLMMRMTVVRRTNMYDQFYGIEEGINDSVPEG